VDGGGFVVWSSCRLCCVFVVLGDFVLDCGLLVLFHPHCSVYYMVPGSRYVGGQTYM